MNIITLLFLINNIRSSSLIAKFNRFIIKKYISLSIKRYKNLKDIIKIY